MGGGTNLNRTAEIQRETRETKISLSVDLDRYEDLPIETGIGFFDHMLHQLSFHGRLCLSVKCEGDTHIDDHHTIEDVGIALGQAIKEALGSTPVERFSSLHTVMDDALALVAMDISGRGYLGWEGRFDREMLGEMSTECIHEFFKSVAQHAGITLHIQRIAGFNEHHVCEAMFKGCGIVLHRATRPVERDGVSSTKGVI